MIGPNYDIDSVSRAMSHEYGFPQGCKIRYNVKLPWASRPESFQIKAFASARSRMPRIAFTDTEDGMLGTLPAGFSVPEPSDDAALRPDEEPLEPGDLDLGLAPRPEPTAED